MRDIRAVVQTAEPDLPFQGAITMDRLLSRSVAAPRFYTLLLSGFGLTALGMALAGIYAMMARAVHSRREEIGVRLALGANPSDVLRTVLGSGFTAMAAGVVLGSLGALVTNHLLTALLYRISPTDPISFLTSAGAMIGVGSVAAYLPARAGVRVDPVQALRCE